MKESKKALITGITGQDGSYLAELLIKKGYIVATSEGLNIEQINPFGLNGLPVPENRGASTIPDPNLTNL